MGIERCLGARAGWPFGECAHRAALDLVSLAPHGMAQAAGLGFAERQAYGHKKSQPCWVAELACISAKLRGVEQLIC